MFPEGTPSLSFKNPVLSAFANAIWHCSSAAEVSIVLNEPLARTEVSPADTEQPSARSTRPSRETIISDYGAYMEHNPPLPTRIEDVSVLPHPKEMILDALLMEIRRGHPTHLNEMMKVGAISLAQYQPGVGNEPLEYLGMHISKLPRTKDLEALRTQAKLLAEAQIKTQDRFNEFSKLVQDDLRRISSKIAAAEPASPKRSPAERFAADLDKRPITRALLLRAATENDNDEIWLTGRMLPDEQPTTLVKEIHSAVLIDALRITTDAREAIGLKWSPFLPGDPLPSNANLVVTFAFFVMLNIVGQVRKEGHNDTDNTLFPQLVDLLFLMGSAEEKLNIYKLSHPTFDQVLRSDLPNDRKWRESLSQLVFLYLIGDEKLKQCGFPSLFGFMLKSLLSTAE
jgi:hypothetical protein